MQRISSGHTGTFQKKDDPEKPKDESDTGVPKGKCCCPKSLKILPGSFDEKNEPKEKELEGGKKWTDYWPDSPVQDLPDGSQLGKFEKDAFEYKQNKATKQYEYVPKAGHKRVGVGFQVVAEVQWIDAPAGVADGDCIFQQDVEEYESDGSVVLKRQDDYKAAHKDPNVDVGKTSEDKDGLPQKGARIKLPDGKYSWSDPPSTEYDKAGKEDWSDHKKFWWSFSRSKDCPCTQNGLKDDHSAEAEWKLKVEKGEVKSYSWSVK